MNLSALTINDFPNHKVYANFEGGVVYIAENDYKYYIITNECAAFDELDEDDREGLSPCTTREFDSRSERDAYLLNRWPNH